MESDSSLLSNLLQIHEAKLHWTPRLPSVCGFFESGFLLHSETHLESRNNAKFTGYNTIWNDSNIDAALLVGKSYGFEKVVIVNLLTCSAAATDNRRVVYV